MRIALAAVLVAVVAGCGGGGPKQQPLGGGAVFVPAGVVAFLAARTDDAGWQPLVRSVLHRRPPRVPQDAVEVDIAVLQGGTTVVMTKPKQGDWRGTAATTQQPSLADDANYLAATRAAPADATARAYIRGDVAGERLAAIPGQIATLTGSYGPGVRVRHRAHTRFETLAELRWRWLSAWATADGWGARIHSGGQPIAVSSRVRQIQRLQPSYPPALLDEIPADARHAVDVTLPSAAFSYLEAVPRRIRTLFPRAGRDLAAELDKLTGGETALYTRPGGETTLVTSPADLPTAEQALHDLGLTGVHTATIGGQLVVSTRAAGIAALRGDGPKLAGKLDIPARVAAVVYERGKSVGWAARDGADATFTVRLVGTGS